MKYVVYAHSINGEVFYIGCGTKARAYDFAYRSTEWHDARSGREVSVSILSEHPTKAAALVAEREAIHGAKPPANTQHNLAPDTKAMPMTISLDASLRKRVDALSSGNRSYWVREAIMQRVEREEKKKAKKGGAK